jgi:hypothetical protein
MLPRNCRRENIDITQSPELDTKTRTASERRRAHWAPGLAGDGGMRCIIISIMFCIMSMRIYII